jgi:hypothetical protein
MSWTTCEGQFLQQSAAQVRERLAAKRSSSKKQDGWQGWLARMAGKDGKDGWQGWLARK